VQRAGEARAEQLIREAFGARILPAEAFTAGLVQRGILSLGMG